MKRTVFAEKFYTAAVTVERCLAALELASPLGGFDLVVEPSAGAGAFFERVPVGKRFGLDIAPEHPEVVRGDFLEWQPDAANRRILTIGNPPFGQRAALAVAFIKHAALFSDVIAFILPRSFQKYTFQNRVPKNFHLLTAFECNEFEKPNGQPITVNSIFQIWEKRAELRAAPNQPTTHPDFEMRHAHLSRTPPPTLERLCTDYEFAIPQVGSQFQPRSPRSLSKGSYWFIKPNLPGVQDTFSRLDFSFLDGMNTAHKSLSKSDIIAAYITAKMGDRENSKYREGGGRLSLIDTENVSRCLDGRHG